MVMMPDGVDVPKIPKMRMLAVGIATVIVGGGLLLFINPPTETKIVTVTETVTATATVTATTKPILLPIIEIDVIGGWPIEEAVDKWNRNNGIYLSTDKHVPNALFTIQFQEIDDSTEKKYCRGNVLGCYDGKTIYLNKKTAENCRLSVVLHELGHALGLQHSSSGVMAINGCSTKISQEELDSVYFTWLWVQR